MIKKLRRRKYGSQFIDDVMETFEMPTNYMNKFFQSKVDKATIKLEKQKKCNHVWGMGNPYSPIPQLRCKKCGLRKWCD